MVTKTPSRRYWLDKIKRANNVEELADSKILMYSLDWLTVRPDEDAANAQREIARIAYALLCSRFFPVGAEFVIAHREAVIPPQSLTDDHESPFYPERLSSAINLAKRAIDVHNSKRDSDRINLLKRLLRADELRDLLSEDERAEADEALSAPAPFDAAPQSPSSESVTEVSREGSLSRLATAARALLKR